MSIGERSSETREPGTGAFKHQERDTGSRMCGTQWDAGRGDGRVPDGGGRILDGGYRILARWLVGGIDPRGGASCFPRRVLICIPCR